MIFLLSFWLVLAEKITLEAVCIGAGICLWTYFFNGEYPIEIPKKFFALRGMQYMFVYLFVLSREIITANVQVAQVVLSRNISITPDVIQFQTKLKSELTKTILANSITLTPGTLTVLMEQDLLTVHCLQKDYAQDVLNSKFEKILLKIEE
jgi:multicomponent Na+:H+ antiporter subunit E